MKKNKTAQQIEQCMESLDGMFKADPTPYLLTRIQAALQNRQSEDNNWIERMAAYISRPIIACAVLLLILAVNLTILFSRSKPENNFATEQTLNENKEEYALNNTSIYYIVNPEP